MIQPDYLQLERGAVEPALDDSASAAPGKARGAATDGDGEPDSLFAKTGEQSTRSLSVLAIDEWLPYPPDSGKRVRTWNILRRLAGRHRISLLCYGRDDDRSAEALRRAGIRVHTLQPPRPPRGLALYAHLLGNCVSLQPYSVAKHYTLAFRNRLQTLLHNESFDLVHCEWTPYARFLDVVEGLPTFVMAHNIESQIWLRRAKHSKTMLESAFFTSQAWKMRRFERAALKRADHVAAVTELDAIQMRAWDVNRIALVENGVDLDSFVPTPERARADRILFLGSLDWFPNLDALEYFVDDILPAIRERLPNATLRVVGKAPPENLKRRLAGHVAVELVGEVADILPELRQAAVVIVPLRIGGGSRIKILEALAMEKGVVSTSIGAEGLALENGVHLLLANTAAEFGSRTADLLTSPGLCQTLGENGRRRVLERYGWDRAASALESAWLQVCEGRPQPATS